VDNLVWILPPECYLLMTNEQFIWVRQSLYEVAPVDWER